ncbi:unnamed protein product [Adineta ricciae]|uniref:Uncharacterized protein n=1 Tax=Adineta ricciae TaxID=249248 RepID=A0A813R261_ADIRI|nr:unnamed protein product [Adineta ricciae]CAF1205451.1 unnamed protein product [Adineta ricciae]
MEMMQGMPPRRRPPMMPRPYGHGQPVPYGGRSHNPARVAPAAPVAAPVHTVVVPAAPGTSIPAHIATVHPATGFVTVATVAGPVAIPVTAAAAAPAVYTQVPVIPPAVPPSARPVARPGVMRQPPMGYNSPFGPNGPPIVRGGPVPPGYRRVIARRR